MANRSSGIGSFIASEVRHAVHDIRQRLFEEAWFGRPVSTELVIDISREQGNAREREPSFEDLWGRSREPNSQPAPDLDQPELDR